MVSIRPLGLDGVVEVITEQNRDERGFLSETFSAQGFAAAGITDTFVQDNHSLSMSAGVLRGLHYQLPPLEQGKLVRVTRGRIFDVAVDIRRGSPSFGKWVALEISRERWNQILIPPGFAHGFVTLEPGTEVLYKVTNHYSRGHSRSIRFDDPQIGIDWPIPRERIILSEKDAAAPFMIQAEVFELA